MLINSNFEINGTPIRMVVVCVKLWGVSNLSSIQRQLLFLQREERALLLLALLRRGW